VMCECCSLAMHRTRQIANATSGAWCSYVQALCKSFSHPVSSRELQSPELSLTSELHEASCGAQVIRCFCFSFVLWVSPCSQHSGTCKSDHLGQSRQKTQKRTQLTTQLLQTHTDEAIEAQPCCNAPETRVAKCGPPPSTANTRIQTI
jgi:hypothetical protein